MTTKNLINTRVAITISDPWEFGTQCGVGPFFGRVVEARSDAVAVVLDMPILYEGKPLASAVIRARYVGDQITALGDGHEVVANFLFSSDVGILLGRQSETGVAAIGSVRPR
jgi:hypothetical protein